MVVYDGQSGSYTAAAWGGEGVLSSGQLQFCELFAADPLDATYNVPLALRLRGRLDVEAMRRAWVELVARHEILQTAYDLSGRSPRAITIRREEVDFGIVYRPAESTDETVTQIVRRHASEPMDLTRSPLRVRLIALAPDDWLLVVVIHHIACDGPSQHVILAELSAFYSAQRTGLAHSLPPRRRQYREYAREESARAASVDDIEFWRTTLHGSPVTKLPTDRPRDERRKRHGSTVRIPITANTVNQVRTVCQAERTTPYVVLLTAFQVLIARYCGTDDVCVGTSVSLRDHPQFDGMIGYFANTVVIRHRWRRGTFGELVSSCRDQVLNALDHASTPIAEVITQSPGGRTPFDVMLDLRQGDPPAVSLDGMRVDVVPSTDGVARFDLTVHLTEAAGALYGELEYSTDLFDRATALRLAAQFARLLDRLTRAPHVPVDLVDVHSESERSSLLNYGEQRQRPLFALSGNDSSIAVTDSVTDLTYGELDRSANRYARWLRDRGVRPGDLVGVRLRRTPQLVACFLGVWRAGAAYVPIDPLHPAGRVEEILKVSGLKIIVDDGVDVDEEADDPIGGNLEPLAAAYVMFTSGSTGRPKGVVVTHRGLANYLGWVLDAYADKPGGAPFFSSIGFDLGVPNLFAPLMRGQTVRLIPDGFDTADLGDLLSKGIPYSFVKLTPGHLDLLTQQLTPEQARSFAGLVIAGGDRFPKRLVERWAELGGSPLASEYGPTEITVGNSAQFVVADSRTNLVPLGEPIPNTSMFVLDADLMPCPVGVIGEVYVGGDGVARGYLSQPGLTADRFLPDLYGPPGARLYRTGDLARAMPDRSVDFLGRTDHQVKVRGYRIELDEIESILTAQPGVHDAVVAVRDDRLVAYLVGGPDVARLRAALVQVVPPHMLPAAFVTIAEIPLTVNGKVDRTGLPTPSRTEFVSDEFVAPVGEAEKRIAQLWTQALGIAAVGATDSFFELGGDSVSAVALCGNLRSEGFGLSVADVFESRTVRALANLAAQRVHLPAPSLEPVRPFAQLTDEDREAISCGVDDAYPIGMTQHGMLLEMLASGSQNLYHNITVFKIRDEQPFELSAFSRAVERIVARHEVMRTTFDLISFSEPLQIVNRAATMALGCTDIRGLNATKTDQIILEHCTRERTKLFALNVAPLMRMHVFTAAQCWWLAITESHPILEGWSYHNQLMELLSGYEAQRRGPVSADTNDTSMRFADFIATEQAALNKASDQDYWRQVLTGYEPTDIPAAWGDLVTIPQRFQLRVPLADIEPGLRKLARIADVPYKCVLLAAHLEVLSRVCPARKFHTGVVCDARPELPGFERVSGMYLNSVPFQFERGATTWTDLVRRTFATEIEMWPHRHFPMPAMPALVSNSARPVNILFHYLDFHQVDTDLIDVDACIDDSPNEFRLVVGTPTPGHLTLASSTDVIRRDHAQRLAGYYHEILSAMAAEPTGAPDGIALYETGSLEGMPTTATNLGPLLRGAPDSIAVVAGDRRYTVEEVRQRASCVTNYLIAQGIGTDDIVGILADRDIELVVMIVGVLNAGAAYLPLDPAHPDDRLRTAAALAIRSIAAAKYAGRLPNAVPLDRVTLTTQILNINRPGPSAEALAYVMPTSGTTSGPKPVAITRRGLATYLRHATENYGRAPGGAAVLSSQAFDISVPSLFVPLLSAQPIYLPPLSHDLVNLGKWLSEGAPFSFIEATTSQFRLLIAQLGADGVCALAPVLIAAGEAVDPEVVRLLPGLRVEYGPTETTVGVCHGIASTAVANPLGRPIDGTTVRLLDSDLRPVPDGVVGELYVSGPSLARGYLAMPGATASRFVPDPHGEPGRRMYATGDLARICADELEFAGRRDDQIKQHGYRIDPVEIEGALLRDDRVVRAVVRMENGILSAYVESAVSPTILLASLRHRLPAYLVPQRIVCTRQFNTTSNWKVDRRRPVVDDQGRAGLPDYRQIDIGDSFRAPETNHEKTLARVWESLTGAQRVGCDDTLRGLGSNSLIVLQVIAELARIGLEVPPNLLRADAPLHQVATATLRRSDGDFI